MFVVKLLYRPSAARSESNLRSDFSVVCTNNNKIESGIPYLLLFDNTGSSRLSIALNVILLILIFLGNITALATCAREMFAFARDKGLPYSKWIGKM